MPKSASIYVCQNCGESFAKWQGQCDSCGEWNTLVETLRPAAAKGSKKRSSDSSGLAVASSPVIKFSEVEAASRPKWRFSTGIGELDRVLGGIVVDENTVGGSDGRGAGMVGMVPGAVMLIGGEPGIGKSTLLTQMVVRLAQMESASPILYAAGEENPDQIALRINRILKNEYIASKGVSGKGGNTVMGSRLIFSTETNVDQLTAVIEQQRPLVVIVDSIQTMSTDELTGAAGSAGQLREATDRLTQVAKRLSIPMFLVGHVTKEGVIAGPKIIEHIVDTVLELSGERTGDLRILRAIKNRFGATDEVGVFRVNETGLEEISNPSQLFLEHVDQSVPGSATVCVMEGTRPLLLEVQGLVIESQLAMPRRVGRGIDLARIQVLSAVLQKHCRLPLGSADIFVSAAGGFRVTEPAVDLGLAVAMASSLQNKPVKEKTLFIGEIGLLGELRAVQYLDRRIKEAKRLGFTKIISRNSHKSVREVLQELGLLSHA
jgi:DNA repair protein RadA/Sms